MLMLFFLHESQNYTFRIFLYTILFHAMTIYNDQKHHKGIINLLQLYSKSFEAMQNRKKGKNTKLVLVQSYSLRKKAVKQEIP